LGVSTATFAGCTNKSCKRFLVCSLIAHLYEKKVRVVFNGVEILSTSHAFTVCETSHPPTWYFPFSSFREGCLAPTSGESFCEWKGVCTYFDVVVGDKVAKSAAWSYAHPSKGFEKIAGFVSLYASKMDEVTVDGEKVVPQQVRLHFIL
jgi:uncharacterized protein (DUF427 family)